MFRQYFGRNKSIIGADLPLDYSTFSFFEEVRQDAFVKYRYALRCIRNQELNGYTVVFTTNASFLYKSADSKCTVLRCFVSGDLCWREEENNAAIHRVEYERCHYC